MNSLCPGECRYGWELSLQIRPATAADLPALMELEKCAASAAHWSREQYEAALASEVREILVAEGASIVQGFLVGRRIDAEWEIENVAIASPARRRGLGTRLVGEFLGRARSLGGKAVFLEVRESNLAARALYEKWAFVEGGRRKRYYREPEEDAVLYRMDLS